MSAKEHSCACPMPCHLSYPAPELSLRMQHPLVTQSPTQPPTHSPPQCTVGPDTSWACVTLTSPPIPHPSTHTLTSPVHRWTRHLLAGFGERHEDRIPTLGGVTPPLGLQHQGALHGVGHHQAVGDVVELAAKAAALLQVAQHQLGTVAVFGVLQCRQWNVSGWMELLT